MNIDGPFWPGGHNRHQTSDSSLVSVVLLARGQGAFQERPAETSMPEYVEVRECSWWLSLVASGIRCKRDGRGSGSW
jgi:hypothetical protein